ncbi:MAG: glycosyltransferase family 2 protein, partial [Armatimonadetes bacterium]|nr:glycosyltransferase family 2 protein [Armatimonadota bacterium]
RKGLDFARNRGIRESSGSFVAFADDDVMVSPQWVDELVGGFSDESIVCVTGLTMPAELRTEAQLLFEKY